MAKNERGFDERPSDVGEGFPPSRRAGTARRSEPAKGLNGSPDGNDTKTMRSKAMTWIERNGTWTHPEQGTIAPLADGKWQITYPTGERSEPEDDLEHAKRGLEAIWSGLVEGSRCASESTSGRHVPENPVHVRARELLKSIPEHLAEILFAIRNKPDYEQLKEKWIETEEGLDVSIVALRDLGRAPSGIIDDFKKYGLIVRRYSSDNPIRFALILKPEVAALIRGEVDASVQ
jgi:hypothetical protein